MCSFVVLLSVVQRLRTQLSCFFFKPSLSWIQTELICISCVSVLMFKYPLRRDKASICADNRFSSDVDDMSLHSCTMERSAVSFPIISFLFIGAVLLAEFQTNCWFKVHKPTNVFDLVHFPGGIRPPTASIVWLTIFNLPVCAKCQRWSSFQWRAYTC